MSNARELAELAGSYGTGGFVGMKNRIINGGMVIDQRNAGASVAPTSGSTTYVTDRFGFLVSQSSKFTAQQSSTAPAGFSNSLLVTSSSSYSVGSSESFYAVQKVEGFNFADMAWGTASAATVTLSFWVRSSLTGTFGAALWNSAANRSYPVSYTISAANTWEQKTITIAGDTTGTWVGATNGIGVNVVFGLGFGSSISGTSGVWNAGTAFMPTGATSVVGTNGATFYITGVQLEKGSTATSFDYRPYGTELALCQRYYQGPRKYIWIGYMVSGYVCGMYVPLIQDMRAVPTISVTSVYRDKFNAEVVNDVSTNAVRLQALSTGTGGEFTGSFTASAEI